MMANPQDDKKVSQELAKRLKKSYAVIDALESKLHAQRASDIEPIAIVGMACRFPGGVNSPEDFWQLLIDEKDGITDVPKERWDIDKYHGDGAQGDAKVTSRRGGFIDDVDLFDANFFGLSPKEAGSLDPQQRILLEVVWQALEEGNRIPETLYGSDTGVYVAMSGSDYMLTQAKYFGEDNINAYFGTGNAHAAACGRIAYFLGLQGPCFSVDTACSSSLVALHNAVTSLRSNESTAAIVASANLNLTPDVNLTFSAANMLAPDGRCKTFDQSADGYVRGEGVAAVVLKRLSEAQKDGDTVHAVIRGSALNQDGASSGLTVPNGIAQQDVIRKALKNARLKAHDISYVEAHGTGTALGDPIEVSALGASYCQERTHDNPLYIGSAKTNIGHTEASAGLAGLIKVVLSLKHQQLPRHLHFEQPSTLIPWDQFPLKVVAETTQWDSSSERIAGLSSFGFGGSNGHVIVSETPQPSAMDATSNTVEEHSLSLVKVTAKSAQSLNNLCHRYHEFIQTHTDINLHDFAYTANTARSDHAFRRVLIAADRKTLLQKLHNVTENLNDNINAAEEDAPVAFLFSGQGSQYWGMAKTLYGSETVFRSAIDVCEQHLQAHMDKALCEILWGEDRDIIHVTRYTQPALFALEYALAKLWQSWGVKPAVVLGHSVGEYVAACIAGVFSLADALTLVSARGRLMVELCEQGAMAVVFSNADNVTAFTGNLTEKVTVAAYNGPENTVLSGEPEALSSVLERIEKTGIRTQRLSVSHAFHSPMMAPMLKEFRRVAESIHYHTPKQAIISNLTGELCDDYIASASYWVEHISAPVKYKQSVETLLNESIDTFIELGPHTTLLGMAKVVVTDYCDNNQLGPERELHYLNSLHREKNDLEVITQAFGAAYSVGVNVEWAQQSTGNARRISIPTYAFSRKRYWYQGTEKTNALAGLAQHEKLWLQALREGNAECLGSILSPLNNDENATLSAALQQLSFNYNSLLPQYGYATHWQALDGPTEAGDLNTKTILIIADAIDDSVALEQAAVEKGANAVIVIANDSATVSENDNVYRFDIQQHSLWQTFFDRLTIQKRIADYCVFYRRHGHDNSAKFSFSLIKSFSSVTCFSPECQMLLVTRAAALISDAGTATKENKKDDMDAGHVCALGASRALSAESPDNFLGCLDLESQDGMAVSSVDAHSIVSCLGHSGPNNTVEELMALRDKQFFAPRLERLKATSRSDTFSIHDSGLYLVSGAFGGIGKSVVNWLITKGVKQLALISRRGLDSAAIAACVDSWQSQGVLCHVLQADISDYDGLEQAVECASDNLKNVKGIFHCAGISGNLCDTDALSFAEYESVLLPKVQGSLNIETLITKRKWDHCLDVFVNFSSIASVWGSAGQAGYCAANYFLDKFSQLQKKPYHSLSLNWGPWNDAGMSSEMDADGQLARLGIKGFSHKQAIILLEHALAAGIHQTVVTDVNWQTFIPIVFSRRRSALLQALNVSDNEASEQGEENFPLREQFLTQATAQRKDFLVDEVCRYLRVICELDDSDSIDPKQGFSDLGVDSLLSVEMKVLLQKNIGLKLPSTLLYDYPTPIALANYLLDILQAFLDETGIEITENKSELEKSNVSTSDVLDMSEDDVEALLLAKLSAL